MTASKLSAASVLLVGAGKMGGAMLRGWVDRGLAHGIVIEPGGSALPDGSPKGLIQIASADQIPADFKADVVVLAVKPQVMEQVAPSFRRFSDAGAVIVSIAAGKTIAGFEKHYGAGAAIVRSMPNLPASIGQGITVACANAKASAAQKELATELLGACGEVAWVSDEALIDPVTALSGGGPAYVFLLIEALAAAGEKLGLAPELAMRLARVTVAGSGALVAHSDLPAADLRKAVSSPGGTTLAALGVLMAEGGMQPLFDQALAAAANRARELAS
jgi:pyrroline-5-carboxylate reductase